MTSPRNEIRGINEDSSRQHSQLDRVIWGMNQILLGSEIALSGLYRRVPEEQLDLLKLAAGRPAELGACTAQIVWRDARNACGVGILPQHLPDDLLAQAFARHSVGT